MKPIGTRSQNGCKPTSNFAHSFKKVATFMAAFLVLQTQVAAFAAPVPTNLNLQSTTTADKAAYSGTVKEGTHTFNITAGTKVTPAVDAALIQEHTSGSQALVINHNGVATGGSLALSNALYGIISTVVIPTNVTGNINTSLSPVLAVTGLFQNLGTVNITGHVGSTATIAAGQFINSGQISTTHGVNLSILALTSVTNSGSITSGGSLLVGAPTVTNSAAGLMQARNTATVLANVFTNAGTLESLRGNVLAYVNTLDNKGAIDALTGSVSIRDAGSSVLSITGDGSIDAKHKVSIEDLQKNSTVSIKDVSVDAPKIVLRTGKGGILDVNAGELSGLVSFKSGSATLDTKNGDLVVSNGKVTGGSLSVDVKNGNFIDQGKMVVNGSSGDTADITAANNITIQGTLKTNDQVGIVLKAGGVIRNEGDINSAGTLNATATKIVNSSTIESKEDSTFVAETVKNGGTIESKDGDLTFNAVRLRNNGDIKTPDGSILVESKDSKHLTISGHGLFDAKDTVTFKDTQSNASIHLQGVSVAANEISFDTDHLFADANKLTGDVKLNADSAKIRVQQGNLNLVTSDVKDGSLILNVVHGDFINKGKLTVNGRDAVVDITAKNIKNEDIIKTGRGVNIVLHASNEIVNDGTINDGGSLTAKAKTIVNYDKIASNGDQSYTAKTLTNRGTINSRKGDLAFKVKTLTNYDKIASNGDQSYTDKTLTNIGTIKSRKGDLAFKVNTLHNTGDIKAPKGSILVEDKNSKLLTIDGSGLFQAKNTVEFKDTRKNSVIDFDGGSVKANKIDFDATTVDVCADELTGNVYLKAHTATVDAEKGNLNLAYAKITSGGLTLITQDGSVNLENSLFDSDSHIWKVVGGLTILSSKNINAKDAPQGATIKVVPKNSQELAPSINLEAGVNISGCCTEAYANGSSTTGGNVNLHQVSLKAAGGDIAVVANGGTKEKGKVKLDNVSISSNKKNAILGTIDIYGQGGISAHNLSASDKADGASAGDIYMFAENGKVSFHDLTSVGQSGNGLAVLGSNKGFHFAKIDVPNGQVIFTSQKDIGVGSGTGQPVTLTNKQLHDVTTGTISVVSTSEDGGGRIVLNNVDLSNDPTKTFAFLAQNITAQGVKLGDTSLHFEGDDSACGQITLGGITGIGALFVDGFRTIDVKGGQIQICNDPNYHGPGDASGDVSFDTRYFTEDAARNGNIYLYNNVLQAGTLSIDGVTLSDAQANALPYVHHDGGSFLYCDCHFHGGGSGGNGGSFGGNSGGRLGGSTADNHGLISLVAFEIWLNDLRDFHQLPPTDYIHPSAKDKAEAFLNDYNQPKGDNVVDGPATTGSIQQTGSFEPVAFRHPAAQSERFVLGKGVMDIFDGETLVSAVDATTIKVPNNVKVELGKHGVAFLSLHNGSLKVKSLSTPVTVYFTDDNKTNRLVELFVGKEISFGNFGVKDGIGRRHQEKVETATDVTVSEYSIDSLLATTPMLRRMVLHGQKSDAGIVRMIMQNAASIDVVTNATHGRYFR